MKIGIREKAIVVPVLVMLVAVAGITLVVNWGYRADYAEALESRVRMVGQNLKLQMDRLFQLGLTLEEVEGYNAQCREALEQNPDLSFAAIIDMGGRILFHSDPSKVGREMENHPDDGRGWHSHFPGDESLHNVVAVSIVDTGGVQRGYAVVGFPEQLIADRINDEALWTVVAAGVGAMAAIVCMWAALSALVVRPVCSLDGGIQRIAQSDYEGELPVHSSDEVGRLADSFNGLLRGIRTRDVQIRRQVNELQAARDQLEERVKERTAELSLSNASLREEITRRQRAEEQRERLHAELVATSRKAGMADMATSVLHNVGNVLNSINVAATLLRDRLQNSRLGSLTKAAELLRSRRENLADYLTNDSQGKQLVDFLGKLSEVLAADQESMATEARTLIHNVNHVKEIVSMQQSMARVVGAVESFDLAEVVEDAIKINLAGVMRHGVVIEREFEEGLTVETDRQRVLQILVNLISNGKYAVSECDVSPKKVVVRAYKPDPDHAVVEVSDNGMGIPAENMPKLFSYGFTTRKQGHGFGLHASALSAEEVGGELKAASEGPGRGATFTLCIPVVMPRSDSSCESSPPLQETASS